MKMNLMLQRKHQEYPSFSNYINHDFKGCNLMDLDEGWKMEMLELWCMQKYKGNYELKDHQLSISLPKIWLRLIRDNKIENRAMFWKITLFVILTWPFQLIQRLVFNRKIKSVDLEKQPPVFILGHWRSGTTHLHYTLAKDPQFSYLGSYQAFLMNVVLLGRTWLKTILSPLMPKTRPQDNIKMTVDAPAEEEQPLTNMSNYSGMQSFFFPKNISYHDKFNLFKGIRPFEKRRWQRHYTYLLKLISYANGERQLLLKNPHNTGRVLELLELFPNAKFVFIHRDPYSVFHSSCHLYHTVLKSQFLHEFSDVEIEERVLYNFETTMGKYLEERHLIPKKNLVEVSFDELEQNPMATVEKIYQGIGLDGLENARPLIEEYLKSVEGYSKNRFPKLEESQIEAINQRWDFAFSTWNYEKRGESRLFRASTF